MVVVGSVVVALVERVVVVGLVVVCVVVVNVLVELVVDLIEVLVVVEVSPQPGGGVGVCTPSEGVGAQV